MARVEIFRGGNVERMGTTGARYRPADFSSSPIAEGLQSAGKALGQAVERQDEVEDFKAKVEANRLAIEHVELSRLLGQKVKQTLGEGAEAAAEQSLEKLRKGSADILGRASPRARLLLESEFGIRNATTGDSWVDHGFREKVTAFDSSSQARIDQTLEAAADEPDEDKARLLLEPVRQLTAERARFFGRGEEWQDVEEQKHISQFYKSRALKMATGPDGSAYSAIEYANANRAYLSDADYNSILSAYHDNALDELAYSDIDGMPIPNTAVTPTDDGRRLDPISFFKEFVSPHEGSALVTDSNGALVKYGVNAAYHPGENIKGMTEARAAQIFKEKYYEPSGADKLPPGLAAVHTDTYWLNQKQAAKILKESGGDVDRYIALRRTFLNGLVRRDPGKYGKYQKGWENRTKALADYAAMLGGDGRSAGLAVGPDTSVEEFRQQTMARTDIGLALKTKLIQRAEARRSDARQERSIQEEEAARDLTQSMTALGDGFTDIKQLPQGAWLRASPAVKAQLTDAAKTNKENKPLSPEVLRDIGFMQTFAPEKLADPKVQAQLAARGVPATKIAQLAQQGGQALGAIAGAKADPIPRGTLESLARPAFEASGHFLWTTEEKQPKRKAEERQREAQKQLQLLSFLGDAAQTWAVNNPGKKADETTIKGWIGTALRMGSRQEPIGTLNDSQVVLEMSAHDREAIKRKLRSAGLPVTVENVATYYRRMLIMNGR